MAWQNQQRSSKRLQNCISTETLCNSGLGKLCHLSSSSKIDGRAIIIRVLSGHVNVDTFPDSLLQLIIVAPENNFNSFITPLLAELSLSKDLRKSKCADCVAHWPDKIAIISSTLLDRPSAKICLFSLPSHVRQNNRVKQKSRRAKRSPRVLET